MSTPEPVALSRNKKIFLRVVIAFLAIAAIGQISAIFLPAMVGQSPNNISAIGTPLWLGLLFLALWSLKSKSKTKGFFIGVFIGFVLHFLAGETAGYLQAETRAIDKAVKDSNQELPKMLDEDTRLDRVSIEQKSKGYFLHLTFINYTLADIDTEVLDEHYKQAVIPATCSDKTFKIFFSEKYSINYIYKDKSGDIVRKYTIKPSDCSSSS